MKSFSRIGIAAVTSLGLAAIAAACSSSGDSQSGGLGGASGTNSTEGAGASTSSKEVGSGGGSGGFNPSSGAFTGTGTNTGTSTNTGSSSNAGGGSMCGGKVSTAEPIPLDIYIMQDKSGSMTDPTAGGMTKWTAITQALDGFFADPASAGLDVGLQFFPLPTPGVPATCTSNADCGTHGPCELKICSDGSAICATGADCPATGSCVKAGSCNTYPGAICYPAGGGNECAAGDPCVPLTTSTCSGADSCTAADYAKPSVEIATLDAAQIMSLSNAIGANMPDGSTPTSSALQGAINHASTWATANPTHTVVVVLATDGLPTECAPTDIASISNIAAAGLAGTPSIKTYVIGVFNPSDITMDQADQKVKQIAMAGGGQAFIVDTSMNVEMQFVAAMNTIRAAKLACEYAVPPPPQGETQDFSKVNVEYTAPGATMATTVGYVEKQANCDPTKGGWYYDVDPSNGGKPTKIIMCPATCTSFQSGGSVSIRVGCQTVTQPPPS